MKILASPRLAMKSMQTKIKVAFDLLFSRSHIHNNFWHQNYCFNLISFYHTYPRLRSYVCVDIQNATVNMNENAPVHLHAIFMHDHQFLTTLQ